MRVRWFLSDSRETMANLINMQTIELESQYRFVVLNVHPHEPQYHPSQGMLLSACCVWDVRDRKPDATCVDDVYSDNDVRDWIGTPPELDEDHD
jgi:hypothetical protein